MCMEGIWHEGAWRYHHTFLHAIGELALLQHTNHKTRSLLQASHLWLLEMRLWLARVFHAHVYYFKHRGRPCLPGGFDYFLQHCSPLWKDPLLVTGAALCSSILHSRSISWGKRLRLVEECLHPPFHQAEKNFAVKFAKGTTLSMCVLARNWAVQHALSLDVEHTLFATCFLLGWKYIYI